MLARSALHHSLVYRSVVVIGDARLVEDPAEKLRALGSLLDHIAPGRAADCRLPNERELAMTAVLALDLVEVSAKVRSGGPADDPEDLTLPHWAGVVPLSLTAGTPVPADDLDPTTPVPPYLACVFRRHALKPVHLRTLAPGRHSLQLVAVGRGTRLEGLDVNLRRPHPG